MEGSQVVFTKVGIECDIREESEATDFVKKLREEGFIQTSIEVNLPKVIIKGEFPGTYEDCKRRCKELKSTCEVKELDPQ